jgi:hypothetical protein
MRVSAPARFERIVVIAIVAAAIWSGRLES